MIGYILITVFDEVAGECEVDVLSGAEEACDGEEESDDVDAVVVASSVCAVEGPDATDDE